MTGYIEVFGHGGDVETAASRFGRKPLIFWISVPTLIRSVRPEGCWRLYSKDGSR